MTHAETLLIAGSDSGTHVGGSFLRAARRAGLNAEVLDTRLADSNSRVLNAVCWRFFDRRPARMGAYETLVVNACARRRPKWLLVTGLAPLRKEILGRISRAGTKLINYLTDDPWNRSQSSKWFVQTLSVYDSVFTPRKSNEADLMAAGVRSVSYLPFAYDQELFYAKPASETELPGHDVVFVGGADRDRAELLAPLCGTKEIDVALFGEYWDRYTSTAARFCGYAELPHLRRLVWGAKLTICLVRRANRDGHAMRSYEVPALGGFALIEDTAEHRELFGETTAYFSDGEGLVEQARRFLLDPAKRVTLSESMRSRVVCGSNTYDDRLRRMLE